MTDLPLMSPAMRATWILVLAGSMVCGAVLAQEPAGAESGETAPAESVGPRNWLVLIAINDYQNIRPLQAPLVDARALRRVLHERYAFVPEYTIELFDAEATLTAINQLFGYLKENVGPQDSIVLYYAGHGFLDEVTSVGYWIPHDGGTEAGERWVVDNAVTGFLRNLRAKHAFVIADSCFSGNLLSQDRGLKVTPGADFARYRKEFGFMSRMVLTSGNLEPVADSGYGNHSPFAYHLIKTLEQNTEPYLDAEDIYYRIRAGVSGQQVLLGALKGGGHQLGGSYIFFLKDADPLQPMNVSEDTPRNGPMPFSAHPSAVFATADDPTPELLDLVNRFAAAYEVLDLEQLRSIWPTCGWTRDTFGAVKGYEIEIQPDSVRVEPLGPLARVSCVIRMSPTGRRKQWTEHSVAFEMERRDGTGWIITKYVPQID